MGKRLLHRGLLPPMAKSLSSNPPSIALHHALRNDTQNHTQMVLHAIQVGQVHNFHHQCWWDCDQIGNLLHTLWECPSPTSFWKQVFKLISSLTGILTPPNPGLGQIYTPVQLGLWSYTSCWQPDQLFLKNGNLISLLIFLRLPLQSNKIIHTKTHSGYQFSHLYEIQQTMDCLDRMGYQFIDLMSIMLLPPHSIANNIFTDNNLHYILEPLCVHTIIPTYTDSDI